MTMMMSTMRAASSFSSTKAATTSGLHDVQSQAACFATGFSSTSRRSRRSHRRRRISVIDAAELGAEGTSQVSVTRPN
jgi:hypothetical protein